MITLDNLSRLQTKADLDAYVQERAGGNLPDLIPQFDAGLNELLRRDLKLAQTYVEKARRPFQFFPEKFWPRWVSMRARYHHFSGRHAQALRGYQEAERLYRNHKEHIHAARVGKAMAEVYMYLGRYPEALETGKQSLRYFRRKKMDRDAAQTMTNIGNVYHRMDRNAMALRYYDKARDIFARTGGVPLAIVDYNRANIMANLNHLQEARQLYRSAGDAYAEAGLPIPETLSKYSIAYLDFLEGRYTEALVLFERVLEAFQKYSDRKSAALSQLDLVELNIQLNQYGSAIMLGEEVAAKFSRMKCRYEEAKAHFFVALARIFLGDTRRAVTQLAKAERLFKKETNLLWQGMVNFARNRLYLSNKNYAEAARASRTARRLFARSNDERRAIDAEIGLLEAQFKTDQGKRAEARAREMLAGDLTVFQRYSLNNALGEFHFERAEYTDALGYFQHAITAVEKMVSHLYRDEIRYFFIIDKFKSYARMVDCLFKLDRVRDAFLQNLSALSLVNQRTVSDARLRAEVPDDLLSGLQELRASLARLNQFPRNDQRGGSTLSPVLSAEQRLWNYERKIRTYLYPDWEGGAGHPRIERYFERNFKPDEILVNYVAPSHGAVGAFIADKDGVAYVPGRVRTEEVQVLIRKLSFILEYAVGSDVPGIRQPGATAEQLLTSLYEYLILPIENRLDHKKTTFLTDGFMAQVPFGALRDGDGQFLKDKLDLRLIVNPDDIMHGRNGNGPVSFARKRNAVFTVSSASLPSVDLEGQRVKNVFPRAHLYATSEADLKALKGELTAADGFIHIAAHAARTSENPLFSRILLHDGPFFPFDLFGTGIRAELTTLSGCQTAAPGLNYGNSFSLAKAFYQAGSRFVLASLWPVSDRLTMIFMSTFYQYLRKTSHVAHSYQKAVNHLQEITNQPAHWASFVLIGT
jgi:tetratricopeptide (TPR) repeat protein